MANTKSALKAIRVGERRRQQNKPIISGVKTRIRNAQAAIESNQDESVDADVTRAFSALDRAAAKGVIHPNNAARRKSRLMKKLNAARAATA